MKKTLYILIILHIVMLVGCKKKAIESIPEEMISFTDLGSIAIGYPLSYDVLGDDLYITEATNDTLIKKMNMNTGVVVASYIPKGGGPGELIPPVKSFILEDSIQAYSRSTMTLVTIPFSKSIKPSPGVVLPFVVSNLFKAPDNSFVASIMPFMANDSIKDFRFLKLSETGEPICYFGSFPRFNKWEKELSTDILASFHQTVDILFPNDKCMLALSGNVLSEYQLENNNYQLIKETILVPYEYTWQESTSLGSATTYLKSGYEIGVRSAKLWNNLIVTAQYLPSEEDTEDIYFIVYDLKGTPIKKLIPTEEITTPFTITPDGHIIVNGGEHEDVTTILKSKNSLSILL